MKESEDLLGRISARRMEVIRTYGNVTVGEKPLRAPLPAAAVQDSHLAALARHPQSCPGYLGVMSVRFDQYAVFNQLMQVIGRTDILVPRIRGHDCTFAGAGRYQDTRQRRRLFTPDIEICQLYLRPGQVCVYSRGKRMFPDGREEGRGSAQVGVRHGGVSSRTAGGYGLP